MVSPEDLDLARVQLRQFGLLQDAPIHVMGGVPPSGCFSSPAGTASTFAGTSSASGLGGRSAAGFAGSGYRNTNNSVLDEDDLSGSDDEDDDEMASPTGSKSHFSFTKNSPDKCEIINPEIFKQGKRQHEYCIGAIVLDAHVTLKDITSRIVENQVYISVEWGAKDGDGVDIADILRVGVSARFSNLIDQSLEAWRHNNTKKFRSIYIIDCPFEPDADFCKDVYLAQDVTQNVIKVGKFLRAVDKKNSHNEDVKCKVYGFCVRKKTIKIQKLQRAFETTFTLNKDTLKGNNQANRGGGDETNTDDSNHDMDSELEDDEEEY